MNTKDRFNELLNNYDTTTMTLIYSHIETSMHTIISTTISCCFDNKYEDYERLKMINKETDKTDTYYLDIENDYNMYHIIHCKLHEIEENIYINRQKRKSNDNINIEIKFKKLRIDKDDMDVDKDEDEDANKTIVDDIINVLTNHKNLHQIQKNVRT